jgi:hypothetical protein
MSTSISKNRGGAPKKDVTMDKNIKFSCTPEVYDFLIEQSKIAGYASENRSNVAAFLRDFLITLIMDGRYVVVSPGQVSREMLKELLCIGINLNQAMHAMNSFNTEVELVNLVHQITATRKILCSIAESITSPQKLQKTFVGAAA